MAPKLEKSSVEWYRRQARGPAVVATELEKLEAGYAKESAWRKAESTENARRLHEIRRQRGGIPHL